MLDFFIEENLDLQNDAKIVGMQKTATTQDGSKSNAKIAQIFTAIEANLNNELVNKTGAVFQFNVKGDEASIWFLDLKNGKGAVGKGEPSQPPDAVLTMDSQNFFCNVYWKTETCVSVHDGKIED